MKLAIRTLALCVVIAGILAAVVTPGSAKSIASHQSATASAKQPIAHCGRGWDCTPGPDDEIR